MAILGISSLSRPVRAIGAIGALIGTATLLWLFGSALLSEKPKPDTRGRLSTAALAPGQFLAKDTGALRYYIIRPPVGALYVLAVPTTGDAVLMPDTHWWKPLMLCKQFSLDTTAGLVTNESRFRCHDSDQPKEWQPRWQWDAHGRHIPDALNTPVNDMHRVTYEVSDDEIVFTGIEPE